MKTFRAISRLLTVLLVTAFSSPAGDVVSVVAKPDVSTSNAHYAGNRAPLEPSRFLPLPIGAVQPKGWLLEFLKRQRDGLCGNLGEISAWLQKDGNAWLSKDGKGKYGWEELPYWLKGYIQLGYIFNDPKIIAESKIWIEGALNSQRADGDFGPDQKFEDGSRDFWANMLMLFTLQTYYEQSHDPRVIDLMTKYFKFQATVPDAQFLTHYWQHMRGGDNLFSVYWLYNRTGDPSLLDLAAKIHRCTANWEMTNDLPDWHNVNIAESFREPAIHFLQTHDANELQAAYNNFTEIRKRYGQVPGGMFGGDEVSRPGFTDPHQAVETCGLVEEMLSDELLMQISGDPFWGDHCENVAFNDYPAAVMPDFRSLRYLTAPNMVVSDSKSHAPGIANGGPYLMMNPFSSRCCQHNHSMGWPYFAKHLWLATPDNGLCAAVYSASEVTARVGDGTQVGVEEVTHYPFEEQIEFRLHATNTVRFPLYLRIPSWCRHPGLFVNGRRVAFKAASGKYIRLERDWNDKDVVALNLQMQPTLRMWAPNHNSVSVNYGPLTFSLNIGERCDRVDSVSTAQGDSGWQKTADPSKWPSFEIQPTTPWNYGLVLEKDHPEKSFQVHKHDWPLNDFPFTTTNSPLEMTVKAQKIPQWTLDRYGLCAALQDSPVLSDEPVEEVSLIPMGAARLRISAFPTIGTGRTAHEWTAALQPKPPLYKSSASHVYPDDTLDALCDGMIPENSADMTITRFSWWPHRGTAEWVQYDFPEPRPVSVVSVYWFDDTGTGSCRVPQSWRLLYKDGESWKPVEGAGEYTADRDKWNKVSFNEIKTTALRIETQLRENFSAGILEWRLDK